MSRAKFLKEQEKVIQKRWEQSAFNSDAPISFDSNNKNKFFVTFPFPYMNGRLHLGHVFTILKADVMARHYMTKDFNVLFPFGFHGTGIPIVAAANNLRKEIETGTFGQQYETMRKMDILESDICKFADPNVWLEYFPSIAHDIDLPLLGCAIDYRRSFTTTNLNPWFSSFVQWQINKLYEKNYLKFGKKMVIYSELDAQPCSDADRSEGVGVDISELKIALVKFNFGSLYVTYDPNVPVDTFVCSKNFKLQKYNLCTKTEILGDNMLMPEYFYRNYINQSLCRDVIPSEILGVEDNVNVEYFGSIGKVEQTYGSGFYTSNLDFNWKNYYEPESIVISRSGDICIVAETDQWYIMYDNEEWQKSVYEHTINNIEFTDEVVKELILSTIVKSHPWPFSRTVGLGTKIPFDDKYIIDSLSDSTIYMAYYTIAHLINKIPIEKLSNETWNCIFYKNTCEFYCEYREIFTQMQNEFAYWYPMDLRVSGKDLVTNHLTMMLFNHWAIFGPEYMPKKIYANGHIMINNEKMSKSKGNFITLNCAVEKYGADVTRFICATAGDDTNDGNFNENEVDTTVLSLYAEIQNWTKYNIDHMRKNEMHFVDHLHLITLNKILNRTSRAYDKLIFRDVVKYGFYEIQTIRNKYENPHAEVFKLYLQAELAIISPLIPHWAHYLSDTYNISIKWPKIEIDEKYNNQKMEWLHDYCQIISSKLSVVIYKAQKKKKILSSCNIIINNNMMSYLKMIIGFDITNRDERKKLISTYTKKNETKTIIELITYMEKMAFFYEKDQITQWLCEDNSVGIISYLSTQFSQIKFKLIYDDNESRTDVLNPLFTFL
jgi:leucyl-tRNA synthetase